MTLGKFDPTYSLAHRNKIAVIAALLACAPPAAFANCQSVMVDGTLHSVCTPDYNFGSPAAGQVAPVTSGLQTLSQLMELRQQQLAIEQQRLALKQQQLQEQQLEHTQPTPAPAPPPPGRMASDTELHAAYCLKYLQDTVTVDPAALSPAALNAQRRQLRREIRLGEPIQAFNLPMLRRELKNVQSWLNDPRGTAQYRQFLEHAAHAAKKLRLYLLPRVGELNRDGLTAIIDAAQAAQADGQAAERETPKDPQYQASERQIHARYASCVAPTWLPF
jgi:hypothetical protein